MVATGISPSSSLLPSSVVRSHIQPLSPHLLRRIHSINSGIPPQLTVDSSSPSSGFISTPAPTDTNMAEVEQDQNENPHSEGATVGNTKENEKELRRQKNKREKRLLREVERAKKRGVCYLSRIPPHMDPLKLRQILSQYGDIERIYLTPEDPAAQVHRKRAGGFRGLQFSEGWVEFTNKTVAKRVANALNGEQTGGRKRSSFYYDIWNIKYLSKFKWDDLTEETAYKNAAREQKLTLEVSAAKRERDFYLTKVEKSRALMSIQERMKKKQKVQQNSGMESEVSVTLLEPKVIRHFPQTQPVADTSSPSKPRISKDVLARVFAGSSK